jgi:hypothetical protein
MAGGQTGVDRAALDEALASGLPVSGWCPRGRIAEDGEIPSIYPLKETETAEYDERTLKNIMESDGTLIFTRGALLGGTVFTYQIALYENKPCLVVDLTTGQENPTHVIKWLADHKVRRLNVAGPRESLQPGIYQDTRAFLNDVFAQLRQC